MKKITNITFPRSGHHLLVDCLLRYYSGDLNFIRTSNAETNKFYRDILRAGKFRYCELYHHCKKYPCTEPETNFQKNHDFFLDLSVEKGQLCVVSYRHPLESIVSLYRWYENNPLNNLFAAKSVDFTRRGWEEFANEKILYWKKFMQKWVINKTSNDFLFITYNELVSNPMITMISVLHFMDPFEKINLKTLSDSIKSLDVAPKNNIKNFEYYDESFFKHLEAQVANEIIFSGLELKFN